MRLIIVSGLSGSGKSIALHTLEDMGFYCIDNLPVGLLLTFASQASDTLSAMHDNIAVGIDARNLPDEIRRFPEMLGQLTEMGIDYEVVFLEADDHTLLKRYSETRRRHPLTNQHLALGEAIARETELLQAIMQSADTHIDTSHTNMHQLRDLVRERFRTDSTNTMSLLFESFGYKHGVPTDADFVFDVRCLPNPHWEPALRYQTGQDEAVMEFLRDDPLVAQMYEHLKEFLSIWVPSFEADNRSYMTVAVGCTGGQHRSVYLVDLLAEHFRESREHVIVRHRELS